MHPPPFPLSLPSRPMSSKLSVVERRLNDFSVEDATNALWALGALGYTVSLKVRQPLVVVSRFSFCDNIFTLLEII